MARLRAPIRLALASSLGAGVLASMLSRLPLCSEGARVEAASSRVAVLEALAEPPRCRMLVALAEEPADPSVGRIIDGKAIAKAIRSEIRDDTEALVGSHGVTPGLAVVLVGNRTDSSTYVRMKKRAAAEVGFYSVDKEFPESVSQTELLDCVRTLNDDPKVHGILVQLLLS